MSAGTAAGGRPPKPEMLPFCGLPDIPALRELQAQPQWVGWEYVWVEKKGGGGKWDKPPVNPRTGYAAKSNDPATWAPYSQAAHFAAREGMAGVGYVLSEAEERSG